MTAASDISLWPAGTKSRVGLLMLGKAGNRMPSSGHRGWRTFVKSASSLGGTHQREKVWRTAGYRRLYLKDKCMHAESFLWPLSCRETGVIEKDGFCQSGDTKSSTCVCSFWRNKVNLLPGVTALMCWTPAIAVDKWSHLQGGVTGVNYGLLMFLIECVFISRKRLMVLLWKNDFTDEMKEHLIFTQYLGISLTVCTFMKCWKISFFKTWYFQ